MVHTFSPKHAGIEVDLQVWGSLAYMVSSRPARMPQRGSQKQQPTNKNNSKNP